MRWVSEGLYRVSTTPVALVALVVFVLFTALVLPAQADSGALGGEDIGSPDTSLFYTRNELYAMAEAYGEAGREAYVRARYTFDVVWPLVYAFFLGTALSWLVARMVPAEAVGRWLNLPPVLGAIFDYLENLATSVVMARYPAHASLFATLAPLFTLVKWVFIGGSFFLLVLCIVIFLWSLVRYSGIKEL